MVDNLTPKIKVKYEKFKFRHFLFFFFKSIGHYYLAVGFGRYVELINNYYRKQDIRYIIPNSCFNNM